MLSPTHPFSGDGPLWTSTHFKASLVGGGVICLVVGAILLGLSTHAAFGPPGSTGFVLGLTSGGAIIFAALTEILILAVILCKKQPTSVAPSTTLNHPVNHFRSMPDPLRRNNGDTPRLSKPTQPVACRPDLPNIKTFPQCKELPSELQEWILSFAPFDVVNRTMHVSKEFQTLAEGLVVRKARFFGYIGNDFREARQYMRAFLTCVHTGFVEMRFVDKKEFTAPCRTIEEVEHLAVSLKRLTVEEIYSLYSKIIKPNIAKYEPLTTYLLKLIESGMITGKVSKKDTVHPMMIEASQGGNINLLKLLLLIGARHDLPASGGNYPLHFAAQFGHLQAVELLLKDNAAINTPDENGRTALSFALGCYTDSSIPKDKTKEIVKILLKNGADVDLAVNLGTICPLHIAILHGCDEILSLLLEHTTTTLNLRNQRGQTAVCALIVHAKNEYNILHSLRLLLEKGVDPNIGTLAGNTPLNLAASQGFVHVVAILLEYKARGDEFSDGKTPLYTLLEIAQDETDLLEAASLLLKSGADPTKKRGLSDTALHLAVKKGFLRILSLMLKKNPILDVLNLKGETPLYLALTSDQEEKWILRVAYKLLRKGANPNIFPKVGILPLHHLAAKGYYLTVELLLRHGIDVNAVDKSGYPVLPFILANSRGRPEKEVLKMVTLFLENRIIDPNQTTAENKTPLFYAIKAGYGQIAKRLIRNGADINVSHNNEEALIIQILKEKTLTTEEKKLSVSLLIRLEASLSVKSKQGETVYHLLVANGFLELLKVVYNENPTLMDEPDAKGLTPLYWAFRERNREAADFLLSAGADPKVLINQFEWTVK